MTTYYEQIRAKINLEHIKGTLGLRILSEDIIAYQCYKFIINNIDETEQTEIIAFNLQTYKSKKDKDYLEISTGSRKFFNKLVKEKCFAKKLIIFPNDDYLNLREENVPLYFNTDLTPPIVDVNNYVAGHTQAERAIKSVFNALVLDIEETAFRNHEVIIKGYSSSNSNLSLKGKVLCCFYKPNFLNNIDYKIGDLVKKPHWNITGYYDKQELDMEENINAIDIYNKLSINDKQGDD